MLYPTALQEQPVQSATQMQYLTSEWLSPEQLLDIFPRIVEQISQVLKLRTFSRALVVFHKLGQNR